MKIPIINQKEINTINKDKSKIPCFGISFENETIRVKNSDRPIIRMIDERGPCEGVLKINDLVLEIKGKKIKNIKNFSDEQKKIKPDELIIVRIKRNRQELNRAIRVISLKEFNHPKQKHRVRLDINLDEFPNDLQIIGVQKKSISYKVLKVGDIILELNEKKIKKLSEYFDETKKVIWGEKLKVKINRGGKILDKEIQTTSFDEYKKRSVMFGVETKLFKKEFVKVIKTQTLASEGDLIKKGDLILSFITKIMGVTIKKKICNNNDLLREIYNHEPTQRITLEVLRKSKKELIEIKLISFGDFLINNEKLTRAFPTLNEPQADLMLREYENSDYVGLSDDFRQKILNMDLEVEKENNNEFFISTSVKKEKVSGKDCFVLYFNDFPEGYEIENNSTYLKIYAFDVTDLDQEEYENIYYETEDYEDNPKLENYIRDNCHIIKTHNIDWSEGSMNLVQAKLLDPDDEPIEKLAFPFSVMHFPKAGKRKIEFRVFICTKELKFHETEGRPLIYSLVNYRPEHFKCRLNEEENFDDYDSYSEILTYDSALIDAEYKQPGYLGANRQKLDSLIIPIGLQLAQIKNNDVDKSLKLVKDNIAYKGDRTVEGGINQTLNLKKFYNLMISENIDAEHYLKEIRNNSKIDERYEIINLLLNIATNDDTLIAKENSFIDNVAKKLELNQNKYQEIKRIETASLKSVDFGDKADESIFGITKDMDNKEKCKILRQEYSRWNSQTNNNDKTKRNRAKEMTILAANLRKQYNC